MYRKYIENLEKWNTSPRRKPLIVWGARQVGKTYLIKNLFAEKYYHDNYIYIDCRTEEDITEYCDKHINANDVLNFIALKKGKAIDKNVLLIFDEAQECLPIITLMKYFCQDRPDIPVIVTGSMVRMKIKRKKRGSTTDNYLFPVGKINQLTIYPLNFEEFLINKNSLMYQTVKEAYQQRKELDDLTHKMVMETFYEYLLIGGMPEVVDVFLKTNDFLESRNSLIDIYDNYLTDMDLYQASSESIIRSKKVFESIYAQLNKESKNFSPSLIDKKFKNRDLMSPIDWLITTHLVLKSSLLKEKISLPLIESNESLYRLYLADIGMFSYQSGINASTFISDSGQNSLSGIFFENYVATEILRAGLKLFYWKGKNSAEFEFILESNESIIPLDVKKKSGSLKSLADYASHNKLDYAVKVSSNKLGYNQENKILTLPFYDVFLFINELKNNLININDFIIKS